MKTKIPETEEEITLYLEYYENSGLPEIPSHLDRRSVVKRMNTVDAPGILVRALVEIKELKEESYGDHWSSSLALKTEDVHTIIDEAWSAYELRLELECAE